MLQYLDDLTPKQIKVDKAWLRTAMVFGLSMSRDPERQVGACVVSSDNMLVSFGYNGFPINVPDTAENWANKQLKNALVKHAEENAILKAPFSLVGGTCYTAMKPCHHCLAAIVNARCSRVVWYYNASLWKYQNTEAFDLIHESSNISMCEYSYDDVIEAMGIVDLCNNIAW